MTLVIRTRKIKNYLINHFIEDNFISSKMTELSNKKTSSVKSQQYDDWVCLMCQNLNYSFRKSCNYQIDSGNRCRSQTKQNNDYLM